MEFLLAGGIIAAVWVFAHKTAQSSSSGDGSSGSGSGTTTPPAGSPPKPPPPVPAPLAPGLYPPGYPGAVPITIAVVGGDGYGEVAASPGDYTGDSKTLWYGPGTVVTFSARLNGGPFAFGTAFDHFEGPGVQTKANPFKAAIQPGGAGYVRAYFATFGIVGF